MIPNINPNTGIHYGVIPASEFDPEVFYSSVELHYNCEGCEFHEFDDAPSECDFCENFASIVRDGKLIMQLDRDTNDVWVFDSTHTTTCSACSPCAPNAGYLTDQDPTGLESYCPPPEWLREPEKFNIKRREFDEKNIH